MRYNVSITHVIYRLGSLKHYKKCILSWTKLVNAEVSGQVCPPTTSKTFGYKLKTVYLILPGTSGSTSSSKPDNRVSER